MEVAPAAGLLLGARAGREEAVREMRRRLKVNGSIPQPDADRGPLEAAGEAVLGSEGALWAPSGAKEAAAATEEAS